MGVEICSGFNDNGFVFFVGNTSGLEFGLVGTFEGFVVWFVFDSGTIAG